MASTKRCIILAGAPELEMLRWDEHTLLSDFGSPIQRFLQNSILRRPTTATLPVPSATAPAKWRSVPMGNADRPIYFEQNGIVAQTQFLSFHNHDDEREEKQLQFLEHSMVVLDNLNSSQIISTTAVEFDAVSGLQTSFLSSGSFATTDVTEGSFPSGNAFSSFTSPTQKRQDRTNFTFAGTVTDLKRIPDTDHITRIQPQTITVNLLVGIIKVAPVRSVRLRRRDGEMDIIDVTVGDETRAGFSISFWLVPVKSQKKPVEDLRATLQRLRSGDIVLLQNVALSSFKGCVYGQSLSKRFAKNSTSVTVLRDEFEAPTGPFLSKLRGVRDWTADFVGVSRNRTSLRAGDKAAKARKVNELPPDTQV